MNLEIVSWKEFVFGDLIEKPYKAHAYTADELVVAKPNEKSIRYITRTGENNGCEFRAKIVDLEFIENGNAISVGDTTATCFYQEEQFITGDHMVIIRAPWLNPITGLFIVTILNNEQYKYSYGRAFLKDRIEQTIVKLPVLRNKHGEEIIDPSHQYCKEGYIPDWDFISSYIKTLRMKPLTTKNVNRNRTSLNIDQWEEFTFDDIFILKGGFYNKKPEHSIEGRFPFLGSTENNNGVTEFYSVDDIRAWDKVGNADDTLEKKIYKGNCIAVTVNGSVCNAFYQLEDFTCSHDITAFYLKNHTLNPYLALFLCTVIMKDKYRWSYGRKPHDVKKFAKSTFKLPILKDDTSKPVIDDSKTFSQKGYIPDWEFMQNYIKNSPYGDRI